MAAIQLKNLVLVALILHDTEVSRDTNIHSFEALLTKFLLKTLFLSMKKPEHSYREYFLYFVFNIRDSAI